MTTRYELGALTKKDLLVRLRALVGQGCRLTADLIAHIAEVDARKLYLNAACSSMFVYCTSRLFMNEGEAYNRIEAARAGRRFPVIFEHVASGALHLTAIRLLAPKLTEENHLDLLTAAMHRSKRDVEQLIADRFPGPDVPTSFRKLPARASAEPAPAASVSSAERVSAPGPAARSPSDLGSPSSSTPSVAPRAELKPLSAERYSLRVTLSRATHDKLLTARDRLRHRIPGGAIDAIIDRALDALLSELEKQQFAKTSRPRKNAAPPREGSRRIPSSVKRVVAARDGYQCTFVDDQGRRCQERGFLEFDHVVPFARGGWSQRPEGYRLRCRAHNQHAAVQAFGASFMERKIAAARSRRRRQAAALVPERVAAACQSGRRKGPSPKPARGASSSARPKVKGHGRGGSA